MSELFRRIPGVGELVEKISDDDYRRRIKNALRRTFVAATAASAFLTPVAAAILGSSLTLLGDTWEDIDNWVDNLSDRHAELIYEAIFSTSLHPIDSVKKSGYIIAGAGEVFKRIRNG